eukprot:jgi/Botrbrau1/23091/Bobra.0243s0030.1
MAQYVGGKPDLSQEYPIRLGNSFRDSQPSVGYCTMRYQFKPATVADCKPGCLLVEATTKRATLQLPKKTERGEQQPDLKFEGIYERTDNLGNDCECVLLFDGKSFVLEKVDSTIRQLRFVKDVGPEDNLVPNLPVAEDDDSDLSDEVKNTLEEDVNQQGGAVNTEAISRLAKGIERPQPSSSTSSSSSDSSSESESDEENGASARKRARVAAPAPFFDGDLEPMEQAFFAPTNYNSSSDEDLNRCSDDEDSNDLGKRAF